jgi:hypothetical protein
VIRSVFAAIIVTTIADVWIQGLFNCGQFPVYFSDSPDRPEVGRTLTSTDSLKQRPWSMIRIKQPEDRKVPH